MCWLVVVHNNSFFQGHVIVIFGTSQQLLQQLQVRPAGSSASSDGAAGHHYLNSVQCLALGLPMQLLTLYSLGGAPPTSDDDNDEKQEKHTHS